MRALLVQASHLGANTKCDRYPYKHHIEMAEMDKIVSKKNVGLTQQSAFDPSIPTIC
jgi:hypothetical protein